MLQNATFRSNYIEIPPGVGGGGAQFTYQIVSTIHINIIMTAAGTFAKHYYRSWLAPVLYVVLIFCSGQCGDYASGWRGGSRFSADRRIGSGCGSPSALLSGSF